MIQTSQSVAFDDDENRRNPDQQDFLVINSITLAKCNGNPAEVKILNRNLHLFNLWGRADGLVTADDDKGNTYPGLGGSFYIENVRHGGKWRSSRVFLPTALHELLLDQIPDDGREFYAQIAAMPARNPVGYTWIGSINMGNESVIDPAMEAIRLAPQSGQILMIAAPDSDA